jgi:hypothetical protein
LGVFGHFPKISKCPYAKNIIDPAFSFEDRSGATINTVLLYVGGILIKIGFFK